jgi:CelD/BcsL family acetyltransferase involved in cellulose biosynthesis
MTDKIDVGTTKEWDEAVAGSDGELFLSRRWINVLNEVFDLNIEAVVERDVDGRIVGALPFCCIDDVRGSRLAILPFSDFVSPVLTADANWDALIDPVLQISRPLVFQTTAGSPASCDERFVLDGESIRHSVTLDGDIDELMARFSQHHRRLVRKATRNGLKFRQAESIDELRAFYELHLGVRKHKYGMLAQPYRLFEALWEQFLTEDLGALVLGFDGSSVVGGCLLLEAGDTLYYKYAASHPDYRSMGVSHGAVVAAMEAGLSKGLAELDLGRSDLDQPGLVDFKRRFGATAAGLQRFRSKDQLFREASEMDGLLTDITELMTQPTVPDHITEQAGDRLYRLFA